MPVDDHSANDLIKVCEQAPFGLKYETLVDRNVRDTYQLDSSLIQIKNPDWETGLAKLVDRVAEALGTTRKVEAKLYKLLLYKEGGHFKKHRDTEKEKNMFATLILQLPSVYEGGALVVYNKNGSKSTHDFGQETGKAPYLVHFAAHYADLEHEILTVTKGYRLALVYSLCWVDDCETDSSSNSSSNNEEMVACLHQLLTTCGEEDNKIGFMLEHKYTVASMRQNGVKALKGIDSDRFKLLKQANSKLPVEKQVSFYIVNASLIIESYDVSGRTNWRCKPYEEESDNLSDPVGYNWEQLERSAEINEWYDEEGRPCLQNKMISLDSFRILMDPSLDESADIDDENIWGNHRFVDFDDSYMGNAEMHKTTKYSKYILVFWLRGDEFFELLKIDKNEAVNRLYQVYETKFNDEEFLKNFRELIKHSSTGNFASVSNNKIMSMLEKVNDFSLVKAFLKNLSSCSTKKLADVIFKFKWNLIKSDLLTLLKPSYGKIAANCDIVKVSCAFLFRNI